MGTISNSLLGCCCGCDCEQYPGFEIMLTGRVNVDQDYQGGFPLDDINKTWRLTADIEYDPADPIEIKYDETTPECAFAVHDDDEAPENCAFNWAPDVGETCVLDNFTAEYPDPDETDQSVIDDHGGIWPRVTLAVEMSLTSLSIDVDCEGNGTAVIQWSLDEALDPEFDHIGSNAQMSIDLENWAGSGTRTTTYSGSGYSGTVETDLSITFVEML